MTKTLKYYLPEEGEGVEYAEYLPDYINGCDEDNPRWFAEYAAEFFYGNRDGWENSWPVQFAVVCPDGREYRYLVGLEFTPNFRATEISKL